MSLKSFRGSSFDIPADRVEAFDDLTAKINAEEDGSIPQCRLFVAFYLKFDSFWLADDPNWVPPNEIN